MYPILPNTFLLPIILYTPIIKYLLILQFTSFHPNASLIQIINILI